MPPKVFAARGKPLHFFDISLPTLSKFLHSVSLLSKNAFSRTINQQSSSANSFRSKISSLKQPMTDATFLLRVVTKILLPDKPNFRYCFS
uniref:Uncharacterized protein n=1 Tax=Rhizophora mucronata TaxID=61149 RepID=A0A2P2QXM4_RHIMU